MRKLIATAVLAVTVLTPAISHADPENYIPGGARDVVDIQSGPVGPRIEVLLSNGATDVLKPCRVEDGRRCYWDADNMGNGQGSSFIVTRGRRHYVNNDLLAKAARAN